MQIVVIGSGPAGMEAARTAAPYAQVTLVGDQPAGRWRHLSGKVWLAAVAAGECDAAVIAARSARTIAAWQERCAAELELLEVAYLHGRGIPGAPGEVLVNDADGSPAHRVPADAVIIATGSSETFPEGIAPDGQQILTSVELDQLTQTPASALVVGDGPVGFELCHILSLLGTAVTWLVPEAQPHCRVAPEVDGYLTRLLERQGVRVACNAVVRRLAPGPGGVTAVMADGARHGTEVAVLAGTHRSDPTALGLSAEQTATDIYGQTKRRGVYLVGDALEPRGASVAMAQARAAALHALGRSSGPADTHCTIQSFLARPQVARFGHLTTDGAHGSVTVALAESVAGLVDDTTEGFLTLAWDHGGRVAGALAVAPHAAETVAQLALAMKTGQRLDELAASYGPHPSYSELIALAARKSER